MIRNPQTGVRTQLMLILRSQNWGQRTVFFNIKKNSVSTPVSYIGVTYCGVKDLAPSPVTRVDRYCVPRLDGVVGWRRLTRRLSRTASQPLGLDVSQNKKIYAH